MNQKLAYVWVALTLSLLICAPAQAGRLSDAKSPYLLSHAEDAIDWHAWRIETLDLARRENKLIFLSIGYASCHWCHVMSRTTFSDPSVIKVLNENYINILVDREERPDLDSYFMKIMSAMIGTSGLPANFFLTPDLVPVFAGGYLAPKSKYGDPGFLKVSMSIAREWSNNRQNFAKDVDITRAQLKAMWQPPSGRGPEKGGDFRKRAQRHWSQRFDRKYGGFGNQPKFPQPNVLLFLLAQAAKGGAPNLLDNIYRTLDHMAAGGIRDQLGGAFHRYAVDRFWQVPHFEIMLNQNALLAQVYLAAFQLSGKPLYAAIARGILDDLILRFRLSRGGFAASLDAESEGGDGQYYTWTRDEVRAVLGVRESALFINSYVDTVHGLIRGRSVLRHLGATDTQLKSAQRLSASRTRLLKARQKRVPPSRDDKVLISWNALVVSALAKAARILDEQRYLAIAQDEMRYLLLPLSSRFGLSHHQWKGAGSGRVFLDDYSFLIQALLDLYEADFHIDHLDQARQLMTVLIEKFQAAPGNLFQLTPLDRTSRIPSQIIWEEDGLPSGNAAALTALHRLVLFGAERDFEAPTRAIIESLGRYLKDSAPLATGLIGALNFQPNEAHEIIIVGNRNYRDTRTLQRVVNRTFLPGTVVAVIPPNAKKDNIKWPLLSARPMNDNKATAYVCQKRLCKLPVMSPDDLKRQLDSIYSN